MSMPLPTAGPVEPTATPTPTQDNNLPIDPPRKPRPPRKPHPTHTPTPVPPTHPPTPVHPTPGRPTPEPPHQIFARVIEPPPEAVPAVVRMHADVAAVVPQAFGVVPGVKTFRNPFPKGVIGVLEVKIRQETRTEPDNVLAVQYDEVALGEEPGVTQEVLFTHPLGRG